MRQLIWLALFAAACSSDNTANDVGGLDGSGVDAGSEVGATSCGACRESGTFCYIFDGATIDSSGPPELIVAVDNVWEQCAETIETSAGTRCVLAGEIQDCQTECTPGDYADRSDWEPITKLVELCANGQFCVCEVVSDFDGDYPTSCSTTSTETTLFDESLEVRCE